MSSKGIMRRARLLYVSTLLFGVPAVFAQAPTAGDDDDLDVTMRVIVDPDSKVPDEIVRRIPLPKPAQPATPAKPEQKPEEPGKPDDTGKPTDDKPADTPKPASPAKPAAQAAPDIREQGRAFGQQVAEEAKQRSEEARRNEKPPKPPPNPKPKPPKPPKPR